MTSGQGIVSYICDGYDWDWFRIDVNAGQQIDARLTDIPVPQNYELYLYSPANEVITWSRHICSLDEHIKFLATTTGPYRVQVFGVERNADPIHPYTLRVDLSAPTPTAEPAIELSEYLELSPRVRNSISLETGQPDVWLDYQNWPYEWQQRLETMYVHLARGEPLPLPDPIPIATSDDYSVESLQLVYATEAVARDVYFAHVAHILHLEIRHLVPWRLDDYSDLELMHLLMSDNYFDAQMISDLSSPDGKDAAAAQVFRYTVCITGCGGTEFGRGSESVLGDPRRAYNFMVREPEQSRKLLGSTREETAVKLTEWFHDYLHHGKAGDVAWTESFYKTHPYLSDRLQRQPLEGHDDDVYVSVFGCWTASALFAELMRSVNIPVKLAQTLLQAPGGATWERHAGLMFDWQRPTARYLIHTDDLYCCGGFIKDPAPGPGVSRGEALWQHVWLDASAFFRMFTADPDPLILARASYEQDLRYTALAAWRTASHAHGAGHAAAVRVCDTPRALNIRDLMRDGLSDSEANAAYDAAVALVTSYGDGDLATGCDRVKARHDVWCSHTGKCDGE